METDNQFGLSYTGHHLWMKTWTPITTPRQYNQFYTLTNQCPASTYFNVINFRGYELSRFCDFFWSLRKFIPAKLHVQCQSRKFIPVKLNFHRTKRNIDQKSPKIALKWEKFYQNFMRIANVYTRKISGSLYLWKFILAKVNFGPRFIPIKYLTGWVRRAQLHHSLALIWMTIGRNKDSILLRGILLTVAWRWVFSSQHYCWQNRTSPNASQRYFCRGPLWTGVVFFSVLLQQVLPPKRFFKP